MFYHSLRLSSFRFHTSTMFGRTFNLAFCTLFSPPFLKLTFYSLFYKGGSASDGSSLQRHRCLQFCFRTLFYCVRFLSFRSKYGANCLRRLAAGGHNHSSHSTLFSLMSSTLSVSLRFVSSCLFHAGGHKWTRTTDLTLIRRAL